jgi:hypothetical protein
MTPSTKVDLNHNRIARMDGLDELAKVLFPGNRTHQRVFLTVFVELKWAEDQFLPILEPIADKNGINRRTLETVRAKMRRMGIIDHVSRFNRRYGYREGWVFSRRFEKSLACLVELLVHARDCRKPGQERKDRDLQRYL